MTRIIILLIILAAAMTQPIKAQSDDEQVLVFRNTGEVNLFFTSEIDSIVMSCYDADSVMHDRPVSQVFHTADTALVVPVNEIDSVAFGSRNTMEFREGVRQITADSIWISDFDGNIIHYKPETPHDRLPKEGELLFYGAMDRLFPVGLAARVTGVTGGGDHTVSVSQVELGDIFSKFFYAGALGTDGQARAASRVPIETSHNISGTISLGSSGKLSAKGSAAVHGKAVVKPLAGYYDFDATVDLSIGINTEINDPDMKFEAEGQKPVTIPLSSVALVFWPEIELNLFASVKGEFKFNTELSRNSRIRYVWHRRRGQPDEQSVTPLPWENGDSTTMTARSEVVASGELAAGPMITFDMRILNSIAGARAKIKLGPAINGKLGMGVLSTISSSGYSSELYGMAKLEASLKIDAALTLYHINLAYGNESETELLRFSNNFFNTAINLFPQYYESRAVKIPNIKKEVEVSMATKSKTKIVKSLDTGFQVADTGGNLIDSVFVSRIVENTDSIQGIDTCLVLQQHEVPAASEIVVRPVFHYCGYTIPAQNATLLSDMQLQPAVFGQSNGAVTYLSGMPFSGSARNDSTLAIAGPYIPVPARDPVFHNHGAVLTGIFLTDITGTWTGTEHGESVTYVFSEDNSGTLTSGGNTTTFTYKLNSPQTGCIAMSFADGNTKTLKVTGLGDTSMTCVEPPSTNKFTLYKQR